MCKYGLLYLVAFAIPVLRVQLRFVNCINKRKKNCYRKIRHTTYQSTKNCIEPLLGVSLCGVFTSAFTPTNTSVLACKQTHKHTQLHTSIQLSANVYFIINDNTMVLSILIQLKSMTLFLSVIP